VVEESDKNLGQLLTVVRSRDEVVLGATDTLVAAQGAGGEAAEDEDQDMICEDGNLVPLVRGLLLHLDEDLVEQGWHWKRQRYCLNQRRSDCGGCVRELVNNQMEASFILR
jgi:hypothetical protein